MAKIFVNKVKEPFEVDREIAEKIKNDWMDKSISRNEQVNFSFFYGTLGDIRSFDMRSEYVAKNKFIEDDYLPLTNEQKKKQAELLAKFRPTWIDEYKKEKIGNL